MHSLSAGAYQLHFRILVRLLPGGEGLQNSAQGFNPGNRQPRRRALKLKGRQIERANNVAHRSASEQNTGWKAMLHWPSGLSSDLP